MRAVPPHGLRSKTTKNTCPRNVDVVSSHRLERSVKSNFLLYPAKEEAVVIIEAGERILSRERSEKET